MYCCPKKTMLIALAAGMTGAALYMMMPHKDTNEMEEGMRKAADELSGVTKELGKAIRSIGESMC